MKNEKFTVQNIKCGGCVNIIREGLQEIPGIEDVTVENETGEVAVSGINLDRSRISEKLSDLGYPET